MAGRFNGTTTKCKVCGKTVYHLEQMLVGEEALHKGCFRCFTCDRKLNLSDFGVVDDRMFCGMHAKQAANTRPGSSRSPSPALRLARSPAAPAAAPAADRLAGISLKERLALYQRQGTTTLDSDGAEAPYSPNATDQSVPILDSLPGASDDDELAADARAHDDSLGRQPRALAATPLFERRLSRSSAKSAKSSKSAKSARSTKSTRSSKAAKSPRSARRAAASPLAGDDDDGELLDYTAFVRSSSASRASKAAATTKLRRPASYASLSSADDAEYLGEEVETPRHSQSKSRKSPGQAAVQDAEEAEEARERRRQDRRLEKLVNAKRKATAEAQARAEAEAAEQALLEEEERAAEARRAERKLARAAEKKKRRDSRRSKAATEELMDEADAEYAKELAALAVASARREIEAELARDETSLSESGEENDYTIDDARNEAEQEDHRHRRDRDESSASASDIEDDGGSEVHAEASTDSGDVRDASGRRQVLEDEEDEEAQEESDDAAGREERGPMEEDEEEEDEAEEEDIPYSDEEESEAVSEPAVIVAPSPRERRASKSSKRRGSQSNKHDREPKSTISPRFDSAVRDEIDKLKGLLVAKLEENEELKDKYSDAVRSFESAKDDSLKYEMEVEILQEQLSLKSASSKKDKSEAMRHMDELRTAKEIAEQERDDLHRLIETLEKNFAMQLNKFAAVQDEVLTLSKTVHKLSTEREILLDENTYLRRKKAPTPAPPRHRRAPSDESEDSAGSAFLNEQAIPLDTKVKVIKGVPSTTPAKKKALAARASSRTQADDVVAGDPPSDNEMLEANQAIATADEESDLAIEEGAEVEVEEEVTDSAGEQLEEPLAEDEADQELEEEDDEKETSSAPAQASEEEDDDDVEEDVEVQDEVAPPAPPVAAKPGAKQTGKQLPAKAHQQKQQQQQSNQQPLKSQPAQKQQQNKANAKQRQQQPPTPAAPALESSEESEPEVATVATSKMNVPPARSADAKSPGSGGSTIAQRRLSRSGSAFSSASRRRKSRARSHSSSSSNSSSSGSESDSDASSSDDDRRSRTSKGRKRAKSKRRKKNSKEPSNAQALIFLVVFVLLILWLST